MQRAAFNFGILYEKIQKLKELADLIDTQPFIESTFEYLHDAIDLIDDIYKKADVIADELDDEE